jgi:CubicO group peptidase (beta-lactamase class C family)
MVLLVASIFAAVQHVPHDSARFPRAEIVAAVLQVMREEHIPAVSVAFARNGRLVWDSAFGRANALTRRRATRATPFPVASLGKPVAAYVALRMVAAGAPGLDQPLREWLDSAWISESVTAGPVRLRHVLSHTAGLSNWLGDRARQVHGKPGERFAYSGVGFMYLQAAIEARTKRPLDSTAAVYAFGPLGMVNSFYGRPPRTTTTATGHVSVGAAVIPGLLVFLPAAAALLLTLTVLNRMLAGRWKLGRLLISVAIVGAWAITGAILQAKASQASLVPFFVAVPVVYLLAALGAGCGVGWIVRRGSPRFATPPSGTAIAAAVLAGGALAIATWNVLIPVPRGSGSNGNAASTFMATSRDLVLFGLELARPQHLSPPLARQLHTPQVAVDQGVAWGLGVGISEGSTGTVLYHWGANPSVRSLLLANSEHEWAIALLANREASREGFARIVLAATGEAGPWLRH